MIYDDYTPHWAKIVPITKGKFSMWRVLVQESYREGFIYTLPHNLYDSYTLTEAITCAQRWISSNVTRMKYRENFGIVIDYTGLTPDHQI